MNRKSHGGDRTAVASSIGGYWDLPGGVMLGGEWHGILLGEEAHEGGEVRLGGVRLGYRTTSVPTSWELELDEWAVSGGPAATLAGPYVQVVVGGGRRR